MLRDQVYLLDILVSARLAISHLGNKTKEQFLGDIERQDSVIRRLLIVGEAAGRVSDQTRSQLPDLAWSSIVGMRNFMIHRYDDVDMSIVWDTVHNDLPPLIATLEKSLLSEHRGGD